MFAPIAALTQIERRRLNSRDGGAESSGLLQEVSSIPSDGSYRPSDFPHSEEIQATHRRSIQLLMPSLRHLILFNVANWQHDKRRMQCFSVRTKMVPLEAMRAKCRKHVSFSVKLTKRCCRDTTFDAAAKHCFTISVSGAESRPIRLRIRHRTGVEIYSSRSRLSCLTAIPFNFPGGAGF